MESEKSTLIRNPPVRGEECTDDLRGEYDGSQPLDTMTHNPEARKE